MCPDIQAIHAGPPLGPGHPLLAFPDVDAHATLSRGHATWLLYAAIGFRIVTHDATRWPIWLFWIGLGAAVAAAVLYVRDAREELKT